MRPSRIWRSRAAQAASRVEVVYGVPDRARIRRVAPEPGVRKAAHSFSAISDHRTSRTASIISYARSPNSRRVKGYRDFRAVVVGSGPALDSVRELARSLDVEDFLLFTGYLSGERLLAAHQRLRYRRHSRSVQRSQRCDEYEQGIQYCALGIPTACYPLKETKRLLGEAGVYAPTFDPAGLAAACLSLMQDAALRERAAAEAARLSRDVFVWENEARKFVAIYERGAGDDAGWRR